MSSHLSSHQKPLHRRPSFWVSIAALVLFVGLAVAVTRDTTLAWDEQVLIRVHGSLLGSWEDGFVILTAFGGALFVALAACIWSVILLKRRRLPQAYFVITSVGGAAVIASWLKFVFERTRPELWSWAVSETSFSFPSAHAIVSSALALTALMLTWRTAWRWRVAVIGVLYVLIVAISRLVLGVHYPSDIIGGWLVSIGWVCLSWLITIYTWPAIERRSQKRHLK